MTEFYVNPSFRTSPLDAACAQPSALCTIETPAGASRYAMPLVVIDFIRCFESLSTLDNAIAQFRTSGGEDWSDARLRGLAHSVLLPRRILIDGSETASEMAATREKSLGNTDKRKSFLTFKVPLLRGTRLDAVAAGLSWLFAPAAVAAAVPFVLALQLLFFIVIAPRHDLNLDRLHAGGILALMALTTISTLTHEFGHIAAAAKFRCRNLEIGWGLYLIFTVMYSDVSEAWGLPRKQRMVVDFGGVYFQSISLSAFLIGYYITYNEIWLFGFLISTSTIVASANPILRLDGYWIISDYFGILNLRDMSVAWLRATFNRYVLRKREQPRKLPISKPGLVVLAVYSAFTVLFLIYVSVFMLQHMILEILFAYPDRLSRFYDAARHSSGFLDITALGFELFWRSMILFGIFTFAYSRCLSLIRLAGKILGLMKRRSLQMEVGANG